MEVAVTPPRIHVHASGESGIFANAYLIETANGVVAVDSTLTVSESTSLRAELDALGKPLLAMLITHAHPDHVAGIGHVVQESGAPVLATAAVLAMMGEIEDAKRALWKPIFHDEWIDHWTYPNRVVVDKETVTFDGVSFRAHDLGAGGDCAAATVWVVETEPRVAFIGDLVLNGTHAYVTDGYILAWLANLERAKVLLAGTTTLYPGHGGAGGFELFDRQREYLLAYCAAVKDLASGRSSLDDTAKEQLAARMQDYLPGAGLSFLIPLGADAVAAELAPGHR